MKTLTLIILFLFIGTSTAHGDHSSPESLPPEHEGKAEHEADHDHSKDTNPPAEKEEPNEFDRQHERAGIISLTDKSFNETISSHAAVLVLFYAPWCIHSRALAPEFIKAGLILKAKNSTVRLARLDASIEKASADRFKVQGYPTLKYFKGDGVIDYAGGKTGESIASWVETKLKPATSKLNTVEEVEKFAAAKDTTVIALLTGGAGSDAVIQKSDILEETAFAHFDELPCGISDNEAVLAHFGATNDTIILFKNIDQERLFFHEPLEVNSIATFVKRNKLPLVVEFTHGTAPDIFGGNITKHALLFVSKSQAYTFKSAVNELKEPARTFKDHVIFIYVDVDADENERILQFFSVHKEGPPAFRVIALDRNMAKYQPKLQAITAEGVTQFVQDVLENKVEPHLPSQELPDDWDKNPVKVLVIKNFDQVTMDQLKTVFVMFYAPWCDHSKELAPIWEQLALDYAGNDTIVIAKMDSSQNELPDIKVISFPTLKLFPANSNSVFDYYGTDRSLKSLKAFLDSGGKVQPGVNDKSEVKSEDQLPVTPDGKTSAEDLTSEGSVTVESEDASSTRVNEANFKEEL